MQDYSSSLSRSGSRASNHSRTSVGSSKTSRVSGGAPVKKDWQNEEPDLTNFIRIDPTQYETIEPGSYIRFSKKTGKGTWGYGFVKAIMPTRNGTSIQIENYPGDTNKKGYKTFPMLIKNITALYVRTSLRADDSTNKIAMLERTVKMLTEKLKQGGLL
jgi:hypothetical protein